MLPGMSPVSAAQLSASKWQRRSARSWGSISSKLLCWYTQQSLERNGQDIKINGPEKIEHLPIETVLILYRVAHEGLTNAIRHGKAQSINTTLVRELEAFRSRITDNGKGFYPVGTNHGLGLVGIRERVELLDGVFSVKTTPGAGTQLMIEIPLKKG